MIRPLRLAAVLCVFWVPAEAVATDLFTNAPIPEVLTPARLHQPQSEVPASVTVIDRNLIEASGARELYEVLQLVPGMNAATVHGNRPSVNYHTSQPSDSRRLLVLIDGRSVYQPGVARVQWNDLPITLKDVERIEVTRGPSSAAYGANAFMGVINIITRSPQDDAGTQLFTRQGEGGVDDWQLLHAGSRDSLAWRLSLARHEDDGYDRQVAGATPVNNSKRLETINFTGNWQAQHDKLILRGGGSRTRLDTPLNNTLARFSESTQMPWEDHQRWFMRSIRPHADISGRRRFITSIRKNVPITRCV